MLPLKKEVMMSLDKQKIIVIGGTRGIGLETTRILAYHGAKLIITGRDQEALEDFRKSIPNVIRIACFDFTDERAVRQFFKTVDEVDHLLLVAGGTPLEGGFLETDISRIKGYFDQKFWGVVRTAKYGIPSVKLKGSITFFIGRAGRSARPIMPPSKYRTSSTAMAHKERKQNMQHRESRGRQRMWRQPNSQSRSSSSSIDRFRIRNQHES
jgi:NAD(P)-dependent dehydrogenase (short-subunit alcohol dehydrogenase family)